MGQAYKTSLRLIPLNYELESQRQISVTYWSLIPRFRILIAPTGHRPGVFKQMHLKAMKKKLFRWIFFSIVVIFFRKYMSFWEKWAIARPRAIFFTPVRACRKWRLQSRKTGLFGLKRSCAAKSENWNIQKYSFLAYKLLHALICSFSPRFTFVEILVAIFDKPVRA